jgi:uncharacterized membrane protein
MNEPPQPSFIPTGVSRAILGTGPQPVVLSETHKTTTVSGPLPSPEVIAGYEKVLAGSADRIIKMAEKEQDHRHKVQLRFQTQQAGITFAGQAFAFSMGMFGIGGGIYLVVNNKSIAGFGVFFTSLATLMGLFFYNRNRPQAPTLDKIDKASS